MKMQEIVAIVVSLRGRQNASHVGISGVVMLLLLAFILFVNDSVSGPTRISVLAYTGTALIAFFMAVYCVIDVIGVCREQDVIDEELFKCGFVPIRGSFLLNSNSHYTYDGSVCRSANTQKGEKVLLVITKRPLSNKEIALDVVVYKE